MLSVCRQAYISSLNPYSNPVKQVPPTLQMRKLKAREGKQYPQLANDKARV